MIKNPMSYGLVMLALLMAVALLSHGCCPEEPPIIQREFVEVKVPVAVKDKIPAEIMEPVQVEHPDFVGTADPAATSALTSEGERRLKVILLTYKNRWDALRKWNDSD